MNISNLAAAEEILETFVPAKVKKVYKLQRMFDLMELVGNPQNNLRVIHVAGTAGKTSTSYFIAKMLQLSGKHVGLTVSPHISSVNERVQVDGFPLPEVDFCQLLGEFLEIKGVQELQPTYFELLVAFAYWVFARKNVDYAVVEVGLGGLLDGTNVVSRADKVCVITDIGFDHVAILGDTLEKIATQKAGIIKQGNAVLMLQQSDEVLAAVYERATQQAAKLFINEPSAQVPADLPAYQYRNWSLARDAYEYVANRDGFDVYTEYEVVDWQVPGRMEVIRNFVLDGAHNPLKFEALVRGLQKQFPGQKFYFILAMKRAHLAENLRIIAPIADRIIGVPVSPSQDFHESSSGYDNVMQAAKMAGIEDVTMVTTLSEAIRSIPQDTQAVITGSLFLLGEAKELLLKND